MRLTNAMRSDIVERAVKKAYDTLDSLARKQVREQVGLAYDAVYEKHLQAVELVPKELRAEVFEINQSSICIQDGSVRLGYCDDLGSTTSGRNFPFPRMYRFANTRGNRYSWEAAMDILPLKKSHPELHASFFAALNTLETVCKEASAFKKQLIAIVSSVNTDKKLLEIMPELAEFISKPTEPCKSLLPLDVINSVRAVLQSTQETK